MTRSPSPRARTVLAQLAAIRPGLLGRVSSDDRRTMAQLLSELAVMREPAVVPALTGYLLAPEPVRSSVVTALEAILVDQRAVELQWLDERCRAWSPHGCGYWHWRDMSPKLLERADLGLQLLGVLSFHPNGWIRQGALHALLRREDPRSFGYVLVRASDWVAPIRNAARSAVLELVSELPAEFVADNLDALHVAAERQRDGFAAFHDDALRRIAHRVSVVETAWQSPLASVRRAALHLCSRHGAVIALEYIPIALDDSDSGIRIAAAIAAERVVDPKRRAAYIDIMRTDRWPAIRRRALRMIAAEHAAGHASERARSLEPFLFDRSFGIRLTARHSMQRGRSWYAALYRRRLLEHERPVTCVYGLGETGDASDADWLIRFLDGNDAGLTCAALDALSRLDAERLRPRVVEFLASDHPAISKRARELLIAARDERQTTRVEALFERRESMRHVRLNALIVLARSSKWDRIIYLMRAVSDRDAAVRELAATRIDRWIARYNRAFIEPSTEQVDAIVARAEAIEGHRLCRFLATLSPFRDRLGTRGGAT